MKIATIEAIPYALPTVRPDRLAMATITTFTRFTPPVAFSHTPSMALRPTSWPGTDPDTIGWTANPAGSAPPQVPHYPSKLAREGRIRNFVPNFGIEDRGDGVGVVDLASKPEDIEVQLRTYATAHRPVPRAV